MQDIDNHDVQLETGLAHPLKALSEHQFAALGGDHVVFVRDISAGNLADLVPEAGAMPEDALYHLVMAANGTPLMVSDNMGSVSDWLDENQVEVAQVH